MWYYRIALGQKITLTYLIAYLRQYLNMNKDLSLFINCGKKFVDATIQLKVLYEKYADEDGFLYLRLRTENTYWFNHDNNILISSISLFNHK